MMCTLRGTTSRLTRLTGKEIVIGDSAPAVTVLGLGRMGLALAQALARAGHTVTVRNRTASRAAPLRELDVAVAESVASACASSAVVIVSVTDYDATREMLV